MHMPHKHLDPVKNFISYHIKQKRRIAWRMRRFLHGAVA